MRFKNLALFIVLFILSCGGSKVVSKPIQNDLPKWVNNPHVNHPKSAYLVAVGVSESKFEAETEAYKGISRIFGVDVSGTETISSNTTETDSEFSKTTKLVNQLTLKTNQKVLNTKIEAIYLDKSDGKYYVLATLHKPTTSEVYVKQIDENKIQIDKWMDIFSEEKDPINQLGYLSKTSSLITLTNLLKQPLTVLGFYGSEVNLTETEKKVEQEKQLLIKQVKVFLSTSEKTDISSLEAVKKAITTSGLQITQNKSEATIFVNCSFTYKEVKLGQKNGTHFALWDFSSTITRASDQSSFGVFTKSGRTGQLNYDAAVKRSIFEINKYITKKYQSFFTQNVFN
jgi:hypothetical protein